MIEIDVLKTVQKSDPEGKYNCIKMQSWFDYRGHICMVFEKCGLSLFEFLRKNHYKPFSLNLVQNYGRQLLRAVAFLHSLKLVHTDLKPENILLLSSAYQRVPVSSGSKFTKRVPTDPTIRLIDFGSATFENQYHSTVVSTRHYRAPEVILGMGWSYSCDVWSVGCILVELLTGDALFQTHENLEHLAMMEVLLGPIGRNVISRADRHAQKYFRNGKELNWPEGSQSRESERAVMKMDRLQDIIYGRLDGATAKHLTNLLHKLLEFTPEDRITPADALKHPFFELELEPEENALFNPLPTSPRVDQSRSANSNQGASKQGTAPQSIPALAPAIAQPVQQQPEPEREA
jgi:dual-specificity kinase